MNAEQIIKKTLDGWFVRVNADGTTKAVQVPLDYIPAHERIDYAESHREAMKRTGGLANKGRRVRKEWPHDEEMRALSMADAGVQAKEIAFILNRTLQSVQSRIRLLRYERDIRRNAA